MTMTVMIPFLEGGGGGEHEKNAAWTRVSSGMISGQQQQSG